MPGWFQFYLSRFASVPAVTSSHSTSDPRWRHPGVYHHLGTPTPSAGVKVLTAFLPLCGPRPSTTGGFGITSPGAAGTRLATGDPPLHPPPVPGGFTYVRRHRRRPPSCLLYGLRLTPPARRPHDAGSRASASVPSCHGRGSGPGAGRAVARRLRGTDRACRPGTSSACRVCIRHWTALPAISGPMHRPILQPVWFRRAAHPHRVAMYAEGFPIIPPYHHGPDYGTAPPVEEKTSTPCARLPVLIPRRSPS